MRALGWICIIAAPFISSLGILAGFQDRWTYAELCGEGLSSYCTQDDSIRKLLKWLIASGIILGFGIFMLMKRRPPRETLG